MPDVERMRRTLAHIEANQGLWNQNKWAEDTACGTTYCYAGWAVVLEGIPVRISEGGMAFVDQRDVPEPWMTKVRERRFDYLSDRYHRVAVSDMAAVILDLCGEGRNPNEHWALFGACNTLEGIAFVINRIESGANPILGGVYGRVREGETDPQEAEGRGVADPGGVSDQ